MTIAISTLGDGIARIRLPEPRAGVTYLVLHQQPTTADVLENAQVTRTDVRVVPLSSVGLSNSRNAALTEAKDDFVLFSDDDVVLDLEGIWVLAQRLQTDEHLALVVGWRAETAMKTTDEIALTRLNTGRVCAPEFMIRRKSILQAGVRFDPEFGLGARYGVGEDYVFVTDILRAGLTGRGLPVVVGEHPHDSTGDKWDSVDLMHARFAVLKRVFGPGARCIWILYLLKHRRRLGGLRLALKFWNLTLTRG